MALGIGREIGIGIVVNREINVGRERSVLKWVLFGFALGCVKVGLIDISIGSECGDRRWALEGRSALGVAVNREIGVGRES